MILQFNDQVQITIGNIKVKSLTSLIYMHIKNYVSDQTVILPKWSPNWRIILAKYQLGHSYTFWTMPILIFSPVQIIMRHPLDYLGTCCKNLMQKMSNKMYFFTTFFALNSCNMFAIFFEKLFATFFTTNSQHVPNIS